MALSTKFQKSASTGSLGMVTRSSRPYMLDKTKALGNKLKTCTKEHLNFCMKSGKNFVIEYSTAAYELAKIYIHEIFTSKDFKDKYGIVKQVGLEQSGAIVDLCYKIYNRKSDGTTGNQLKYVVNLYHTQSKFNVNGNRVDLFINEIFNELCNEIGKNFDSLEIINSTIATQISSLQTYTSEHIMNASKNDAMNTQVAKSTEKTRSDKNDHTVSDKKKYLCIKTVNDQEVTQQQLETLSPKQDKIQETCPFCLVHVEDGIACDSCNFWFHYHCVGLKEDLVRAKLSADEYFCPSCSEDMLYHAIDPREELMNIEHRQLESLDKETSDNKSNDCFSDELSFETRNSFESLGENPETSEKSMIRNPVTSEKPMICASGMINDRLEDRESVKSIPIPDMEPSIIQDINQSVIKEYPTKNQICSDDTSHNQKHFKTSPYIYDEEQTTVKSIGLNSPKKTILTTSESQIERNDTAINKKQNRGSKQKQERNEVLINQKSRILHLENEVKQLKTVLTTYQEHNCCRGDNDHRRNEGPTQRPAVQEDNNINHRLIDSLRADLIEHRLRSVEMQMMQNMCLSTAISTHLALQSNNIGYKNHLENHRDHTRQFNHYSAYQMRTEPEHYRQGYEGQYTSPQHYQLQQNMSMGQQSIHLGNMGNVLNPPPLIPNAPLQNIYPPSYADHFNQHSIHSNTVPHNVVPPNTTFASQQRHEPISQNTHQERQTWQTCNMPKSDYRRPLLGTPTHQQWHEPINQNTQQERQTRHVANIPKADHSRPPQGTSTHQQWHEPINQNIHQEKQTWQAETMQKSDHNRLPQDAITNQQQDRHVMQNRENFLNRQPQERDRYIPHQIDMVPLHKPSVDLMRLSQNRTNQPQNSLPNNYYRENLINSKNKAQHFEQLPNIKNSAPENKSSQLDDISAGSNTHNGNNSKHNAYIVPGNSLAHKHPEQNTYDYCKRGKIAEDHKLHCRQSQNDQKFGTWPNHHNVDKAGLQGNSYKKSASAIDSSNYEIKTQVWSNSNRILTKNQKSIQFTNTENGNLQEHHKKKHSSHFQKEGLKKYPPDLSKIESKTLYE